MLVMPWRPALPCLPWWRRGLGLALSCRRAKGLLPCCYRATCWLDRHVCTAPLGRCCSSLEATSRQALTACPPLLASRAPWLLHASTEASPTSEPAGAAGLLQMLSLQGGGWAVCASGSQACDLVRRPPLLTWHFCGACLLLPPADSTGPACTAGLWRLPRRTPTLRRCRSRCIGLWTCWRSSRWDTACARGGHRSLSWARVSHRAASRPGSMHAVGFLDSACSCVECLPAFHACTHRGHPPRAGNQLLAAWTLTNPNRW